jgi:hypothetical protein
MQVGPRFRFGRSVGGPRRVKRTPKSTAAGLLCRELLPAVSGYGMVSAPADLVVSWVELRADTSAGPLAARAHSIEELLTA